jgi:spore coat protein CotH
VRRELFGNVRRVALARALIYQETRHGSRVSRALPLPIKFSTPLFREPQLLRATRSVCRAAASVAAIGALAACSTGSGLELTTGVSAERARVLADELYSMGHLVEVQIELDPGDWDRLRFEGRDMVSTFSRAPEPYEYSYFDATVTIDGVRHDSAGVRKKGYWGSLSAVRPSFKIDLARYLPSGSHFGVEKLTLNNDRSDPSHTHECMAYALFARAGLPASRCNLAHVVVNGVDLGAYSNVEPVDSKMLARHFTDARGNLYEGQRSDFTRANLERIELKTNEKENDRSGLLALTEALEASDDELLDRLEPLLDLEGFRDFWAMELLTGHWDGYANNANNFLAYHDPESGRFHLLPWGTDSTFENADPRGRVYARGQLARRLYALPEQRALYWQRVSELASTVWDVEGLLEHIDQVAAIAPDAPSPLLEQKRQYVRNRQARLRPVLAGAPPRPRLPRTSPCEGLVADIQATFATTVSAPHATPHASEDVAASLSLDGEPIEGATWSGHVALEPAISRDIPTVRLTGRTGDDREVTLQLHIEPSSFQPGTHPLHGSETYGILYAGPVGKATFAAHIGSGSITWAETAGQPGAPVRGHLDARTYQVGCAFR